MENKVVVIYCPGCKDRHYINIDPTRAQATWGFNGSLENPTFTPSLLVRTGKYVNPDYKRDIPAEDWVWFERSSIRCHSFITDGNINYLADCTHELKGQTIELPDVETPIPQYDLDLN